MRPPEIDRERPATNEALSKTPARKSVDILADSTTGVLAARRDLALLVTTGLRTGGVRRHVYFNTPSAQRAVDRAEARGVPVAVRLVRMVPAEVALDTTTVPSSVVDLLTGGDPR